MKLNILELPPLWESLPPKGYGAIEYLVAAQVEEFIAMGHNVTIFASGDSVLDGKVVPMVASALNHYHYSDPEVIRMVQFVQAINNTAGFDIIHCHLHSGTGWLGLPMLARYADKVVFSIHTFATEENRQLISLYPNCKYIAASQSHGRSFRLPFIDSFVYHGIRLADFPFHPIPNLEEDSYLAFLGRLRPEKGVHLAIQVARAIGLPLKIGGRVKAPDQDYFKEHIEPFIKDGTVEFVGELSPREKAEFMGKAIGLVNPTLIEEPFGLVVIEAMACGTPVLATPNGAMKELIFHEETGLFFSIRNIDSLAKERVLKISREKVRASIEQRFSHKRMAQEYAKIFETIALDNRRTRRHFVAAANNSTGTTGLKENQLGKVNAAMTSLLVISPHPDDETLYFGGLIRRAIKSDFNVYIVYITSGHNGETLGLVAQEDLWKTRTNEASTAAKILGVTDAFFMHYKDFDPSSWNKPPWRGVGKQLISWAKGRITKESVVVAFPPNGMNGHPDHVRSAKIANKLAGALDLGMACITTRDLIDYPERRGFLTIKNRRSLHVLPTHIIRLLPDEHAAKLSALACYKTQALSVLGHIRRCGGKIDEEVYNIHTSNSAFTDLFRPIVFDRL